MITTVRNEKTVLENGSQAVAKGVSTRDRVMSSTMSVDEYFDELIDQVREDYAARILPAKMNKG